ncbi:hypothetical protein CM318V1_80004 [Carnobacterium maltaromaticum]|nr:hypothetical protein CM318V1_80004 [Carnobacterium maltaromaticum]
MKGFTEVYEKQVFRAGLKQSAIKADLLRLNWKEIEAIVVFD